MYRPPKPHSNPHGKTHYVFSFHTFGCLPETIGAFTDYEDAVGFFAQLFDDAPPEVIEELRELGSVDLPVINRATIRSCDCGEPWVHTTTPPDQGEIQDWLKWLDNPE